LDPFSAEAFFQRSCLQRASRPSPNPPRSFVSV
jgi:hypothetical protein